MLKKYLLPILLFFLILEIGLRVSGISKTYSEKTNGIFTTYYGQEYEDSYHDWTPNTIRKLEQPEFEFSDSVNSIGLVEKEIELIKAKNTFRVITIGDSFTEGDGASYENTYPRNLERILNENSDTIHYEIINAGVCGSDIFYMNKLLEDKLLKYKPDAVIYLLNQSDIDDIIFRGGEERFLENGTVKFKKAPWILPYYKYSHVIRVGLKLFDIDDLLLTQTSYFKNAKNAKNLVNQQISEYNNVLLKNNIKSIFLKHPFPINLIEKPFRKSEELILMNFNKINGIDISSECLTTFNTFEYDDYAWAKNGHFNAFGYKKLAEIIHTKILEEDSQFFKFKK